MTLRGPLARIRYALFSLLLECAIVAAVIAALTMIVPTALILAAQLYRLATTGEWRAFEFLEFLDVLRVNSSAVSGESHPTIGFLLALPAALILFLIAVGFGLFAGLLHRLNMRERTRFRSTQKSVLLKDIQREIERT
jgi:hypothetical protein